MDRIEAAERLHDLANTLRPDPEPFIEQARESLAEKIKEGKLRVGVAELLDFEANKGFDIFADLANVLLIDYPEQATDARKLVDRLIKAYLDANEDLVMEEAARLAYDEAEGERE